MLVEPDMDEQLNLSCRIVLQSSDPGTKKPIVSTDASSTSNMFTKILEAETTPGVSPTEARLEVVDISFANVTLTSQGHGLSFRNVTFYDTLINIDSQEINTCSFQCIGCSFEWNKKVPIAAVLIDIKKCTSASITMNDITFNVGFIRVEFLSNLSFKVDGLHLTHPVNRTRLEILQTSAQPDFVPDAGRNESRVSAMITNVNTNLAMGPIIKIRLLDTMSKESVVNISNIHMRKSGQLLDYGMDSPTNVYLQGNHEIIANELTIKESQFSKDGPVIKIDLGTFGNIVFKNSVFSLNAVKSIIDIDSGKGTSLVVDHCVFHNNSVSGGVLVLENSARQASVLLTNSNFTRNIPLPRNKTGSQTVEIVANQARITLDNLYFGNNSLWSSGGAMQVRTKTKSYNPWQSSVDHQISLFVLNSVFERNSALRGFGGGLALFLANSGDCNVTVGTVAFLENRANGGAGIHIDGNNSSVNAWMKDTIFELNSVTGPATICGGSGGVSINSKISRFTLINGHFGENKGNNGGAIGICSESLPLFSVRNANFNGNQASESGGAVCVTVTRFRRNQTIQVDFGNFRATNNSAGGNGGFFHISSKSATDISMRNIVINSNSASGNQGGAISFVLTDDNSNGTTRHLLKLSDLMMESNEVTSLFGWGGAMGLSFYKVSCDVRLRNSTFVGNNAPDRGGAIVIQHTEQSETRTSGSVSLSLDVLLEKVKLKGNFLSNEVLSGDGGAVCIMFGLDHARTHLSMVDSEVTDNRAKIHGGGIFVTTGHRNVLMSFENSLFYENKAGRVGHGGAISVFIRSKDQLRGVGTGTVVINVKDCTFVDNLAGVGGAIYQGAPRGAESMGGQLAITNCSFHCCTDQKAFVSLNGTFAFSQLPLHLDGVNITEESQHKDLPCPIPGVMVENHLHPSSFSHVRYHCVEAKVSFEWNKIFENSSAHKQSYGDPEIAARVFSLKLFCDQCREQPFLRGNGTLYLEKTERQPHPKTDANTFYHSYSGYWVYKTYPCYDCPFGGNCIFGYKAARPNYWGYKNADGFLTFQACPKGYCCDGLPPNNILCMPHDGCAAYRRGTLCGKCYAGYSQSLMSVNCVPDKECDDWWIWPVGLLVACSYLIWYMYKGQLMPLANGFIERVLSFKDTYLQSMQTKEEKSTITPINSTKDVDKGYFDIMVYFVNVISLVKVRVDFQSQDDGTGVLYDIEKYFTRYLDVDMQEVANVTVCPFPGMDAKTKYLARPTFVIMILSVWFALMTLTTLLLMMCKQKKNVVTAKLIGFKQSLIEGYVETMKYSYSGLAAVTFLFLTCVPIRQDKVWKYDGEVVCFSQWQIGVIIFAILYTIPFSFCTIVGLKLLRLGEISHYQFMVGPLCPLPFLLVWTVKYVMIKTKQPVFRGETSSNAVVPHIVYEEKPVKLQSLKPKVLSEEAERILQVYQGPYRQEFSSWEGIIEIRKLCFSLYYLIHNNIYRLMLCSISSVIILVSHARLQPFKNRNSNRAEVLSLSMLCIACVTNSIKTVFPESGILIQRDTPTEQLLYLMNRLDRVLILIVLGYIVFSELFLIVKELSKRKKA